MMKKYLFIAAAMLGLVACNNNEPTVLVPGKQCTLTASINLDQAAQSAARKIAPGTVSGGQLSMVWNENDQITISNGKEDSQVFTIVNSSISGATASFTGTALQDMSSYTVTYGDASVTTIDYQAGTFTPLASGKGEENEITIDSYCPVLELNLTGAVTLTSIKYYVSDVLSTTLNMGAGVTLTSTATTIYFPVINAAAAGTAKLEFCDADGIVMNKTASVAIESNNVYSMPTLDVKAPATKGKAKRKLAGGGEVDVDWVQLWAGGPKWATYNVGATTATEYGDYLCWGGSYANGVGKAYQDDHSTSTSDIQYGDDDTAKKLWGNNWQLPTAQQIGGLLSASDLTTKTWIDNYLGSGVNGYLYTGKGDYADNSIFLPAAGRIDGSGIEECGTWGYYWTSQPSGDDGAYVNIVWNGICYYDWIGKFKAASVRPILHE